MIARVLAIILLVLGLPRALLAAEPFARAEVVTKGKIVAGQQVEIAVDILVPNFFKGAPEFPLFPLNGAIVTLPDQRALNMNDSVDGVDYSGIRKSYMVMAQHDGSFALPELAIDVAYADDDGNTVEGKVTLPPVSFTADAVPGDWGDQMPLVTTSLKVSQSLDRDPATLKVGDALVRTIKLAAADTQPMMLPEPDFPVPEGVKPYRADPALADPGKDAANPDAATRTDTVTYVVGRSGAATLPAVDIKWFNPQSGKMEVAEAPAVTLKVAPNPTAQVIPAGAPVQSFDQIAARRAVTRSLVQTGLTALAALALYGLFYLCELRLRAWLEASRQRRAQSEHTYFKQATKALSGREPLPALRSLDLWTRRMGYRTSAQWVDDAGSSELRRAFDALQRALFGGGGGDVPRTMAELARILPTARAESQNRTRSASIHARSLPALNP